jgi:AcrR family transcriptional regulator
MLDTLAPMTWDSSDPSKKRAYHHGNLREALIEAALRLIGEKGPWGFTVAEAARAAGVSPAAPYRHFRDRDELMADIARRGFESFTAQLTTAWGKGLPTPGAALKRVGAAYLAFARAEPAAYAAMFEAGLPMSGHPELHRQADAAFGVLREACEALIATMPATKRPPAMMVALHIWAMSHGVASLFARGDAARRPIPMTPEDLLEAGVILYLDGLARP